MSLKKLRSIPFFMTSDISGKSTEKLYYQEEVKFYVKEYIEHYDKIGLIWGLTTLTQSELFGKDPLSDRAPIGMGMVNDNNFGRGIRSNTVFYDELKYHVQKALLSMDTLPDDFLTSHLDVIAPEGMNYIFLGNTLRLNQKIGNEKRTGYLTIGAHGGPVLGSPLLDQHIKFPYSYLGIELSL